MFEQSESLKPVPKSAKGAESPEEVLLYRENIEAK